MADPPSAPDVHERFSLINRVLQTRATRRWTLTLIERLLPPPPAPGAESYLLELSDALRDAVSGLDPMGWTPDIPARLAARMSRWASAYPLLADLDAWENAIRELRIAAARLYLYAGDLKNAFLVLQPTATTAPFADGDPADAPSNPSGTGPDTRGPKQRLRRALRTGEVPEAVADAWSHALSAWERSTGAATLPVVESHPTGVVVLDADASPDGSSKQESTPPLPVSANATVGGLLSMRVSLLAGRTEPGLSLHGLSLISARPLNAIQSYMEASHPASVNEGFAAIFDLANQRDRDTLRQIQGESGGLAMAALLLTSIKTARARRDVWSLRQGTVWTGQLSADGNVQPVSDNTLKTKVQAAFFSPARRIVVPSAQEEAAQQTVDDLTSEYPNRPLHVVPVSHMRDVERNGTLLDTSTRPWLPYLAETATRQWAELSILAILLIGALLLYATNGSVLSSTPSRMYGQGKDLIVENADGRVLERIQLTEPPDLGANTPAYTAYALADVDGDGMQEACWADWRGRSVAPASFLRCKRVGAEDLLWETRIEVEANLPGRSVPPGAYVPHSLLIADLDATPGPEIYLSANHDYAFPGVILKIDARTGSSRAKYIHPGPFHAPLQGIDVNGDGRREVVTGGVSDAYGTGVIVALSPDSLNGHAPAPSDYRATNVEPGREIAYFRLPPAQRQGDTSRVRTPPAVRRTREEDGGFSIVQAADPVSPTSMGEPSPDLVIRFDQSLKPVSARMSRGFAQTRRGPAVSLHDSVLTASAASAYLSAIERWTGNGWTPAVE